jgi:phosphatidylglycerophosphate synthase
MKNAQAAKGWSWFPNALTVLRLLLGMAFPLLPSSSWIWVCAVAGATEFFDGYLSRLWDVESDMGRYLDPVADKVFVMSVMLTFVAFDRVTIVELLLVGVRDIVVALGLLTLAILSRTDEIRACAPRPIGKLTTWFQFAFLLTLLLAEGAPAWLLYATALMSTAAAGDYVVDYARRRSDDAGKQ